MALGISPYKKVIVPLNDYNPDDYLTLLYNAMLGLNWHISYFDHDGLIAYTNLSWESYAEEVSVRIQKNTAVIKSECVGYQGFFTDYGKNAKNLELLFGEIEYTDFHLSDSLEQKTGELMRSIPENQFVTLAEPPMVGKETLRGFFDFLIPRKYYMVTPILVIVNTVIYFMTTFFIALMWAFLRRGGKTKGTPLETIYLYVGFSGRSNVLHGQVWRLVTNTFLHFSFLHLAGNMIALIYIGAMIESKLGKWCFLALYLLTGICASMASVIWRDAGISGGASGAIFGLFGILLALCSTKFYEANAHKAILISTAFFVGLNIIPIGQGIDHAAHFGGLISGYIFGLIAYWALTHQTGVARWSIGLSFALTCAFVLVSVAITPDYKIKEFEALVKQADSTELHIQKCFYRHNELSHQEKIDTIEQYGLPLIKQYQQYPVKYAALPLPTRKRKEVEFRTKIIKLECQVFQLVYRESKEQDFEKYRPEMDSLTNNINDVRMEWGHYLFGR